MRRRLTLTMVLLTVGTLVVTGVVTLALTVHTTRSQVSHELAREAAVIATTVRTETARAGGDPRRVRLTRILGEVIRPLRLEGSGVAVVGPGDSLRAPGRDGRALPDGIGARLDVAGLVAGRAQTGREGSLLYAAAPVTVEYRIGTSTRHLTAVIVLARRSPSGLAIALPWLLVSTIAVLALAVLVADRVARRTARPLRATEAVTARIAAGDLTARVGDVPGADPELRNLAASVNSMAEALASAQGTQRQFLLSVSHELRTPLTSIRGFAEALQDGTTTDVGRAAGIITSEARRLERLVSDLLELARLDTGRFPLRMGPVDLAPTVTAAVAAFEPSASDLGLLLTTDAVTLPGTGDAPPGPGATRGQRGPGGVEAPPGTGGPDAPPVLADPDRLAQIVSNLVENALNHASSRVHVGAASAGAAPTVWVDDDGPGIAEADRPYVFTRLFSSSARPGRRVGSGLGLAIVSELVTSMGGTVRAESPLGPHGGTRVVVTLQPAP